MVSDHEIERIIPIVRTNCAASGGCVVYKNGDTLTCVMGDEELCYVSQEDGRYVEKVKEIITNALK